MRNKEVEDCIFDLTQCAKSKYPHDLKVIVEYIEKLERGHRCAKETCSATWHGSGASCEP